MLTVKKYHSVKNSKSNLVAFVNFYSTELKLHLNNCRLIRKKNGGFFVGYPCEKIEKEGEETQYFPYYCFEKERNDQFQSAAQKAIKEWINENNQGEHV